MLTAVRLESRTPPGPPMSLPPMVTAIRSAPAMPSICGAEPRRLVPVISARTAPPQATLCPAKPNSSAAMSG